MQQYLPFTVLKHINLQECVLRYLQLQQYLPFTVLKRYAFRELIKKYTFVATVLTVYGIETMIYFLLYHKNKKLQQYLPFIVLNLVCLIWDTYDILSIIMMRTIMEIE